MSKVSWIGAVMACDVALDCGDKIGAIKAHCVMDRLAKKNKQRRAAVHDYGNRIQQLIFAQWLGEHADDEAESAIDPEGLYEISSEELGNASGA